MSKIVDRVSELAEPLVKAESLELVTVEYQKEGSDWILRVFIENLQGKLTLEHCENISKLLSNELDREDPISQQYILEVSSPGIERPLIKKKDYNRFIGELIELKTYAAVNGKKEFRGILNDFKDDIVIIADEEDTEEGVIEIPFAKIASANLSYDF